MRILQICSAREIGGGEKHLAGLANALTARGHDVFVGLAPHSPLISELRIRRENILEVPMRNALNLKGILKLARFVRNHDIDIIHAHIARDYPLSAMIAWRAGRVSLVLTRHVLFRLSKIHRLTFRRVSRVIAVSKAVADGLYAQRLFDPDKIVLIHNGIDVESFSRAGHRPVTGEKRFRVGMIGHLAAIKGQADLICAAAAICKHRDDVEFVLAGEDKTRSGENRRQLERLISKLQLSGHVRLVGWVDDVDRFLGDLDLFVSPAHSEPFGLSIIEAMAAGVPVIASSSEGAREIIESGISGLLIGIGDVGALRQAISTLLDDSELRESFIRKARESVREKFSLNRMVTDTERVYRQAIDSGCI